jgi:NADH dehydrogenase
LIGGGKTRFQPVYAGDVGAAVAKILKLPAAAPLYELGGPQAYSFRQLMEIVLRETHRRRLLLPLPFGVAGLLGLCGDLQAAVLPFAPVVTSDQVKLLKSDNVAEHGLPGLAALGVAPTGIEAVVPTYLWRFRKGGQFAQPAQANA